MTEDQWAIQATEDNQVLRVKLCLPADRDAMGHLDREDRRADADHEDHPDSQAVLALLDLLALKVETSSHNHNKL